MFNRCTSKFRCVYVCVCVWANDGGGWSNVSEIERDRRRQRGGERVWLQSRLNTWHLIRDNMTKIKKTTRGILLLFSSLLLFSCLDLPFGCDQTVALFFCSNTSLNSERQSLQSFKMCFIILVPKQLKVWHLRSYLINLGGLRGLPLKKTWDRFFCCGCTCCWAQQKDTNIKPAPVSGAWKWIYNLLPDNDVMWNSQSSIQFCFVDYVATRLILWH